MELYSRSGFLRLADHGNFWNRINAVRKKFRHMLEGKPKHVACGESPLFHRSTCESRKSNDVASRVDVRNGSLKELIDFHSSSRVRNKSRSFQMKVICVALTSDAVDECVT